MIRCLLLTTCVTFRFRYLTTTICSCCKLTARLWIMEYWTFYFEGDGKIESANQSTVSLMYCNYNSAAPIRLIKRSKTPADFAIHKANLHPLLFKNQDHLKSKFDRSQMLNALFPFIHDHPRLTFDHSRSIMHHKIQGENCSLKYSTSSHPRPSPLCGIS